MNCEKSDKNEGDEVCQHEFFSSKIILSRHTVYEQVFGQKEHSCGTTVYSIASILKKKLSEKVKTTIR